MAKGKDTKKKNLKLRRQLRKTLGCLFMVSAIIVTTIPVTPAEAAGEWDTVSNPWAKSLTSTKNGGAVPFLDANDRIYQTEDGTFQFAYVDDKGDSESINSNKFAVITGYLKTQSLTGGKLTIPNTVDAYVKYTDTLGTTGGYAAAGKNGKPLYYKTTKFVYVDVATNEEYQTDGSWASGVVTVKKTVFDKFNPCSKESKGIWSPDGEQDVDLFYYTGNTTGIPASDADLTDETKWELASGNTTGRIMDAKVSYIGNEYSAYNTTYNDWKIQGSSTSAESVFGGTGEGKVAANIVSLTIGSNLLGIGDYAFYNCFNIEAISFSDGLNTLGNWSFANCGNLVSVEMPYNAMIDTIGHHAFYNCGNLKSFALPTVTSVIGDSAFENCTSLTTMDLIRTEAGTDKNSNLQKIGYKAFKNCTSLQSLTFPKSYDGMDDNGKSYFHLSTVQGCKSLKFISTQSETMDFVTDKYAESGDIDGSYGFKEFKADVGETFYIEAPGYVSGSNNTTKTPSHKTANTTKTEGVSTVTSIAFKYYGEDKYEIVVPSTGTDEDGESVKIGLVYAVNKAGDLIVFRVEDVDGNSTTGIKVPELTMPEQIGPYGIYTIAYGSFNDNCWVEKVTIPASVITIAAKAFQGSHNLKHVIFTEAANIESIGADAFATQEIRTTAPTHAAGGQDGYSCKAETFLSGTPFLSFSGAVENSKGTNTAPFKYAMKADANINEGRQPITYITYYSGFPSNLTIKYNPDISAVELQGFPTKAEVVSGYKNTDGTGTGTVSGNSSIGEYLYPYITSAISSEAENAFSNTSPTENQVNMKNSVYNVVIPTGVTAIKEGLFSGLDKNGYILGTSDTPASLEAVDSSYNYATEDSPAKDIQSITTKSIPTIESYTFAQMPELISAYISGASVINNYAFDESAKLVSADIGPDTATLGLRPFRGCTSLTNVTFTDSQYFAYSNGIIYGLTSGVKTKIVECLESRGNAIGSGLVGPDEFSGIKEIAKEAFMDCDDIGEVDLTKSSVVEIPERCFAESKLLYKVTLPGTARAIRGGAFWNMTILKFVQIPNGVQQIAANAFAYTPFEDGTGVYGTDFWPQNDQAAKHKIEIVCDPTSNAALYAADYSYLIQTDSEDLLTKWSVMFFDASDESNLVLIKDTQVTHGQNVELPTPPDHTVEGLVFDRWSPSETIFNPVTQDREILALYKAKDATTYTVRFFDYNKAVMSDYTQEVVSGKDAVPPSADKMAVDGMVFTGWDRAYTNITAAVDIYATYEEKEADTYTVTFWADTEMTSMVGKPQQVAAGESAIEPAHPTKTGYTFSGWFPATLWQNVTKDLDVVALFTSGSSTDDDDDDDGNSNSNNSSNSNSDSGSSSDNSVSGNTTKYTVVVHGGSGSGDYTPGTIVTINAYATADGKVFDKWTSSSAGVGFVDASAISTTFTMPSNNADITANLKTGSSSSVSSNSRNTLRNSTTSVDVTKSGISNTDLASANVNGSSDNYVIRITEDAQATAAVIAALEAKYGDLSNIAYWPMDISLYDSTGQTKITDVSGITVDITLPLPDELVQYAGNNKAASVVNSQLEELGAKFTTIDGVPCIQFTATHFSPYTIYVDKANLTEGLIDATPKTGDPIHPKWFLAIGLACISVILFAKKDKVQPKVKTA